MAQYTLTFVRSARKELQSTPDNVTKRILAKIELLASNPRPSGCKKLQGRVNLWRIRVGEYRIVYSIDDSSYTVDISVIRHRSEAYQ